MTYRFKITIEAVGNEEASEESPLEFEVENNDDILQIIKILSQREDFSPDEAKEFGLGIKLFSGVMLKNRKAELFKDFLPHFGGFMKKLKSSR